MWGVYGKWGSVLLVLFWMTVPRAAAQVEMRRAVEKEPPTFFFDAIAYSSERERKSRVDIYVQVPYQEIRFVKEGDRYVGRYEVVLGVYAVPGQLVMDNTWRVEVRADDFAQTTSPRFYSLRQRSIDIDPGQYILHLQVRDVESGKISDVRRSLLVTDFRKDPLSLSDIMLVSRLSTDGEVRSIIPNISGQLSPQTEGFFVFFEVYNQTNLDSVDLTLRIRNLKNEERYRTVQREAIQKAKTQAFLKVDSLKLPLGNYVLTIDAVGVPKEGMTETVRAQTSRTFVVRSSDLPAVIVDINKAIDQLIYIARDSEIQYIRDGEGEDERRRRFLEFWARRDPDPQTPRNELMEEYYQRVEYANKNFTHYLEGWRTDMGMVYIRFGSPENIERHPFDHNAKPYEVWYYYQLNRQFVFVDETGFGDYRLRYPTTDLWGRIR
jgi:GWxTD domain-containing protein